MELFDTFIDFSGTTQFFDRKAKEYIRINIDKLSEPENSRLSNIPECMHVRLTALEGHDDAVRDFASLYGVALGNMAGYDLKVMRYEGLTAMNPIQAHQNKPVISWMYFVRICAGLEACEFAVASNDSVKFKQFPIPKMVSESKLVMSGLRLLKPWLTHSIEDNPFISKDDDHNIYL